MFVSRRAATAAARLPTRALSTASPALSKLKPPALSDITHSAEATTSFKTKVSSFRAALAAKKHPAPKPSSTAATSTGGIVKGLLYGSVVGQKEEAEMEQSYSQVLARGKYVHAIEFHHVRPDKHAKYVELVGGMYPKIAGEKENQCHLVGSWKTEIGDCDTFVHIWEYQGYAGYHHTLSSIARDPAYASFQHDLSSLLTKRRTDLMQEFSFWPTSPPRSLGGIFELRSYRLHPGNLLEWETHWRQGLKARRNVMEGVGAWFCQVGALNNVHYLWQYADLRERQVGREQSWKEKGWAETVHKTVPLIQRMESRILVPMPWSPVS